MRYVLLIYGDEAAFDALSAEDRRTLDEAWEDYAQQVVDRGVMRGGDQLAPTGSATTVKPESPLGSSPAMAT